MDAFEREIINELNAVRLNPQSYISLLREYKNYFHKNEILKVPNVKVGIKTIEGPSAYEEAAKFLENQKPINPIKCHKGLCKVALELLDVIQRTPIENINSINTEKIIQNYGTFLGSLSQLIDFGGTSPQLVVSNFLVSDGDSNREQRKTEFNEDLCFVGIAHREDKKYEICTVIVICSKFTSTNLSDDTEINCHLNSNVIYDLNNDNLQLNQIHEFFKIDKDIENEKSKKNP